LTQVYRNLTDRHLRYRHDCPNCSRYCKTWVDNFCEVEWHTIKAHEMKRNTIHVDTTDKIEDNNTLDKTGKQSSVHKSEW